MVIPAVVTLAFLFGVLVGLSISLTIVGVVFVVQLDRCFSRIEKIIKS